MARAVRELRLAAGLSERAAARLLGTSQTQLRRMEDPRYLPSLRSLARLASAYGHRLKIAFESKDRPTPKPTRPAPARARAAAKPAEARPGGRRRAPKRKRS
jgi:transcriptional regulator with XRE-family HTH domain